MTLEEFNKKYPSIKEQVKHIDEDVEIEDYTLDETINISNNRAIDNARSMQGRQGLEKEIFRHNAVYYRHIAVWLEELKRYREILNYIREYRQQCEDDCKGIERCEKCNQMLFDEIEEIVRRELDD